MSNLPKKRMADKLSIVRDKKQPLEKRQQAHRELMQGMLNPKPKKDFNPATFDPMDGVDDYEVKKRPRKSPPRRLPTMGMLPKELLEGQMVGMFESKQDLYLLIAWLSERVTDLEEELARKRA